jgi:hypothetical protein
MKWKIQMPSIILEVEGLFAGTQYHECPIGPKESVPYTVK